MGRQQRDTMNENTALDWLTQVNLKIRDSIDLVVPGDETPNLFAVAMVLLASGLLFGVFGARFARPFLSVVLGSGGLIIGAKVANHYAFPIPIGGLLGFAALAAICYHFHRVWVGVAVALLAGTIGSFGYGHDTVWPEFIAYARTESMPEPPEPPAQVAPGIDIGGISIPNPWPYLKEFHRRFQISQPEESKFSLGILSVCVILGFLFGALYTRWALILSCATIATILICSGTATFADRFVEPGWEARLSPHPIGTLGFIGCCLLLSTLAQYRLTQPRTPPPKPPQKPKN